MKDSPAEAGDYEGFANALTRFMRDQSMNKTFGENAKAYFMENFTQEKHFELLEQVLANMISSRK